jgi:hypothetical protein
VWAGLVVGALSLACTRDNPAFGREDGDSKGDDGEGGDDVADDVADDDDGDGDAGTSASSQDAGDDVVSSTDGGDDGTSDSIGDATSTGGDTCDVPATVPFDVLAFDAAGDEIAPACGDTFVWQGAVLPGASDSEMVVAVCPDTTCDCDGSEQFVTLEFTELEPSPVDALGRAADSCVALMVSRRLETDGCGVAWIVVESIAAQADWPMYLAASSGDPGWSIVVPEATLGDPLDVCDTEQCGASPPGDYEMWIGDEFGPVAPGQSAPIVLNPYAGVPHDYEATSLFARIDGACQRAIGWAAVAAP